MISVGGREWGTAVQIATRLGPDVTSAMVRRWRERDGLPTVKVNRQAYSPLAEAATIERDKRMSSSGRPRQLDIGGLVA